MSAAVVGGKGSAIVACCGLTGFGMNRREKINVKAVEKMCRSLPFSLFYHCGVLLWS